MGDFIVQTLSFGISKIMYTYLLATTTLYSAYLNQGTYILQGHPSTLYKLRVVDCCQITQGVLIADLDIFDVQTKLSINESNVAIFSNNMAK